MADLTTFRSWVDGDPEDVRSVCFDALTIAAEGGKAGIAKPLRGMGSGVLEIKTPARDIELVKDRLKALREMLR